MTHPMDPAGATIEPEQGEMAGPTEDTSQHAAQFAPETEPVEAAALAQPDADDTPIGEVIAISGSKAKVLLYKAATVQSSSNQLCPHIGTVLTVDTGVAVVLCLITGMSVPNSAVEKDQTDTRVVDVDLVGELVREQDGYLRTLRRGCSVYPRLGDHLYVASHMVLEKAYHFNDYNSVAIGTIHQDPSIPAVVKVDDLLGKHFAIVGSTGSGKSCTVALILRQILQSHPNAHVVLLDPHNEYDACFTETAELVRLSDLSLPFWFLNFEELVEILIGDRHRHQDEVEILRDIIPFAKRQFASNKDQSRAVVLQKTVGKREKYTVDVPVPYRVSDVTSLLDAQMGRLENKKDLAPFKRLRARIDTICHDPRYEFMFGSLTVQDNLSDILKRLFRIPVNGKPITVIQLMGLPAEIVNVVVSVLARLAFDLALWSDGKMPITFVCEEAHRYVPRDVSVGFEPTKRAISRIAKEGRKYGVSLCVVSQRPGDLDPTILSQCSTLFTMRLSNERDQDIIRRALPDAAESLIDFLPSLGTRETIVFGEGVSLPSHILLSKLPADTLPKGNTAGFTQAWSTDIMDHTFVDEVVHRWRVIGELPEDAFDPDAAAQAIAATPEAAQPAPAEAAVPQQPAPQAEPPQQQMPESPPPPQAPLHQPMPERAPLHQAQPPAAPGGAGNSAISEALAERFKKLNF